MAFDQRSLIHRKAWFPGGPRIPKKPNCLKNRRKNAKNSKTSRNMPKFAIRNTLIHREAWFPPCFVRQNPPKKIFFCFVWRFKNTSKQKCSNLRPLLSITFPQGFRISINIGHPTLGNGGKETFKRCLKSEHMDRQTDRRTDGHFDF